MIFSRISIFFVFSTFFSLGAISKPINSIDGLEEHGAGASSVQQVLTTLKSSTDSILPEIKNMVFNKTVAGGLVEPLLKDLIQAFNTARASVASIPRDHPDSHEKRQDDISSSIAELIEEIATVLSDILGEIGDNNLLGPLVAELDSAIVSLLISLSTLLGSVLSTVASLLATVTSLLDTVGLGLILGVLGLSSTLPL